MLIGDILVCTSRFLLFAVCTAFLGLREKEFGRVLQHSGVDRVAVNQMLNPRVPFPEESVHAQSALCHQGDGEVHVGRGDIPSHYVKAKALMNSGSNHDVYIKTCCFGLGWIENNQQLIRWYSPQRPRRILWYHDLRNFMFLSFRVFCSNHREAI